MTYEEAKLLALANVLIGDCPRCHHKEVLLPLAERNHYGLWMETPPINYTQVCPCGRLNYWPTYASRMRREAREPCIP